MSPALAWTGRLPVLSRSHGAGVVWLPHPGRGRSNRPRTHLIGPYAQGEISKKCEEHLPSREVKEY